MPPANAVSYTHLLFDDYRNTQIILTLPDGVSIVEGVAGSRQNVTEVTREGNIWRLMLTESLNAASSQSGTITIPLLIEGNGERGVGRVPCGMMTRISPRSLSMYILTENNNKHLR